MTLSKRILDWLLSDRGQVVAPFLFWVFYFVGQVVIVSTFIPIDLAFLQGVSNVFPLAILFYINSYLVNRFLEKGKWGAYFFWALLVFTLIVIFRVYVQLNFLLINPKNIQLPSGLGIRLVAILSGWVILVGGVFYQLLVNRAIREKHQDELIKEQQQAQLQFLRAQINPHFLFNTLNNIYSLAVTGSKQTAEMVLRLSDLLRYVIYDGQLDLVQLSKEVDHLQKFIELFQMKQAEERNIQFEVSGPLGDQKLEPMILIPLVENCFKYCDFEDNEQAFITIYLLIKDGELHFNARNTFNPEDQQRDRTGGVGLENIRHRLGLKYPEHHQLRISNDSGVFEVQLQLPLL